MGAIGIGPLSFCRGKYQDGRPAPNHRDGRREHEEDEAPGDVDGCESRDDGNGYNTTGREQQPRVEERETSNQIVGQRVHQSEKDADRNDHGSTVASAVMLALPSMKSAATRKPAPVATMEVTTSIWV